MDSGYFDSWLLEGLQHLIVSGTKGESCLVPHSIVKWNNKVPRLYLIYKGKVYLPVSSLLITLKALSIESNNITAFLDVKSITWPFLFSLWVTLFGIPCFPEWWTALFKRQKLRIQDDVANFTSLVWIPDGSYQPTSVSLACHIPLSWITIFIGIKIPHN